MESRIEELHVLVQVLLYLGAFGMVAAASGRIAGVFGKLRLPLITGFLLVGLVSGPQVLGLISAEALPKLGFINEIALAFIAFAVGSELYLSDLKNRMRSIVILIISQAVLVFGLVSLTVFYLTGMIPFLKELGLAARIAVSLLTGTIAIATSPAASIAVIRELRARGPFTLTSIGVTVVKDFVVIILFSVVVTLSKSLFLKGGFTPVFILQVAAELMAAAGLGFVIWFVLRLVLSIKGALRLKKVLVLATGLITYMMTGGIRFALVRWTGMEIHVEPLLICIAASFLVTNYSRYRVDFMKILHETGPYVYVVFFTLTGARISLDVVAQLWYVTLILFGARILAMAVASSTGSAVAGDPPLFVRISWMPFITQAGISLGLATIIASAFPGWGAGLSTILISVIVLNEIVGPPLFKWALNLAGETHVRPDGSFEIEKKVLVFGMENQSFALANQLRKQGWQVEFVVPVASGDFIPQSDYRVHQMTGTDPDALKKTGAHSADTLLCLLSDEENLAICTAAYEQFGTRHLIVRLNERKNYQKFTNLGAMVMDPATAMVSLLEHLVRAPIATSIFLGTEQAQDTVDIELRNSALHGLTLRDLRLPVDVIVLSVTRGDQPIISHGYTRLRLGDMVTLVGSGESLDQVRLTLQGY